MQIKVPNSIGKDFFFFQIRKQALSSFNRKTQLCRSEMLMHSAFSRLEGKQAFFFWIQIKLLAVSSSF